MRSSFDGDAIERWLARETGIPADELTRTRIEEWQTEALRRMLAYVSERGAYYRGCAAAYQPTRIEGIADLTKL